QVLDSRTRSPWRLSFLSDLFWGVVEFIGLFFQTLVQPDLSKDGNASSLSRFSDGRG
ncbi:selenoprotein K, partial [Clarias magur]